MNGYTNLISFDENNKLKFNVNKFREITSNVPDNTSISIISILGPYRTGKSFLMNCLLDKFLNNRDIPEYKENIKINNIFPSGYGNTPVTDCIMIYNKPIIKDINGFKRAIFFLDTPGLFDTRTDQKSTIVIFGIIALISSQIIYNIDKRIQENHLENIALFSEYASLADNKKYILGDIDILIRDYQGLDDVEFSNTDIHCHEYLDNILDSKNIESLNITRNSIEKCFNRITCSVLPHPGWQLIKKNYNNSSEYLNKDFIKHLNKYTNKIIDKLELKSIQGKNINLEEFSYLTVKYTELFNNSDNTFPKIQNILEITSECQLYHFKNICLEEYKDLMVKYHKNQFVFIEKLSNKHEIFKKQILKKFDCENFSINIGNKKDKFINNLELEIENVYESIKIKNDNLNPCKNFTKNIDPIKLGLSTVAIYTVSSSCSNSYQVCYVGYSLSYFVILSFIVFIVGKIYLELNNFQNVLNIK